MDDQKRKASNARNIVPSLSSEENHLWHWEHFQLGIADLSATTLWHRSKEGNSGV